MNLSEIEEPFEKLCIILIFYPNNKNLAKLMISFANATGGYIILGIE